MTESETGDERRRHATGIPGLDDIVRGGLLSGSVYIVRGTPGAGKTILANQICFNGASTGVSCLYITLLAESHDRLIENLRAIDFYSDDIAENIQYQSGFHALEEEGLKGILRMLAEETKRYDSGLVVLDGLFALQEKVDSDRAFRLFMNQLQNFAHLTGSTLLLLTNSDRGAGSPEYTMVDGWLELAVQQHGARVARYLQVHKLRGSGFIEGQHSLTISAAGVQVLPRLESIKPSLQSPPPAKERLATGVNELDAMLGGGLMRGSNTLLVGATGVGKTALGLHFIAECSSEEPGLIFGFYEQQDDLIDKACVLGIEALPGAIASGAVETLWHAPTEHVLDELAYTLIAAIRRRKVKRLFLDGIDALRQSALHPERLSRFLAALNKALRDEGVTAVFTLETPELIGGETRLQFTTVSALAQNIILLRYTEISSEIKRTISIVKARTSQFDPLVREFTIAENGVRIKTPVRRTDDLLSGHGHPRGPGVPPE